MRAEGYNVIQAGRSALEAPESTRVDVCSYGDLSRVVGTVRPDVVLHLSAVFSDDFEHAFATNVIGAKNLFKALEDNRLDSKVILAGSAAEYGIVYPHENPVSVNQVLRPVSVYGLTKSWQTQLGLLCASKGQDVVVARIFNLRGNGISDRLFVGRVNDQLEQLAAGTRDRIVTGPLGAVRDYISLEAASAQLLSILRFGRSGAIYHVASGTPVSMRELLLNMLQARGFTMEVVDEVQSPYGRGGFDVPAIYANIEDTLALMESNQCQV